MPKLPTPKAKPAKGYYPEPTEQSTAFGARVAAARQAKGLSMQAVADEIRATAAYILKLEGGYVRSPGPQMLERTAKLFEFDADSLLLSFGYAPSWLMEFAKDNADEAAALLRTLKPDVERALKLRARRSSRRRERIPPGRLFEDGA